jgi:hypothetical protein
VSKGSFVRTAMNAEQQLPTRHALSQVCLFTCATASAQITHENLKVIWLVSFVCIHARYLHHTLCSLISACFDSMRKPEFALETHPSSRTRYPSPLTYTCLQEVVILRRIHAWRHVSPSTSTSRCAMHRHKYTSDAQI